MKKRSLVLAAIALILVLSAGIGLTSAYFTAYTRGRGYQTVTLGESVEIYERVSNWTKHVMLHSDEDSVPVFIRARAFWGETYDISYTPGEGWVDGGDGWWYYQPVLNGGEDTTELDILIGNVPDNVTEGTSFNVIVVSESTAVLYDENGAAYADWNTILDVRNWPEEGGND